MGSPYLLAHGMGEPVENAWDIIDFPEAGEYWFWVRTKDWVPDHPETPGIFRLIFNEKEYPEKFGITKIYEKDKVKRNYLYDIKQGWNYEQICLVYNSNIQFLESFADFSNTFGTFRDHALVYYSISDRLDHMKPS
jgi:hypothetical protein